MVISLMVGGCPVIWLMVVWLAFVMVLQGHPPEADRAPTGDGNPS